MSQNSPAMTMSQTSRAARPPPDSMVLAYGQSYQRVSRSCLSDAVSAVPWGFAAPPPLLGTGLDPLLARPEQKDAGTGVLSSLPLAASNP